MECVRQSFGDGSLDVGARRSDADNQGRGTRDHKVIKVHRDIEGALSRDPVSTWERRRIFRPALYGCELRPTP